MVIVHYIGLHVLTGSEYPKTALATNEADFMRVMDKWNRIGCGKWVYFLNAGHSVPILRASPAEVANLGCELEKHVWEVRS